VGLLKGWHTVDVAHPRSVDEVADDPRTGAEAGTVIEVARRERGLPGLPIKLGACSNAEVPPVAPSPVVAEAVRRAWLACDDTARRIGWSRRRFLQSSMASAVTLLAVNACTRESRPDDPAAGTFDVPTTATTEPEVADDALGGDGEPIVDVQQHLLEFDSVEPTGGRFFGSQFPQAACGDEDARMCFSIDRWYDEVFLRSDTTVAVLSAIPIIGQPDPLSAEVMERARRMATALCGDDRVLVQGHAQPNVGDPAAALDAMRAEAADFDLSAWKAYTHAGPPWRLDDGDPTYAPVAAGFLDLVREIGPPVVAVHKGLAGQSPAASPVDVGPAAAAHPDISFVVYHSGFEFGVREDAFDPAAPNNGVDRLVASLRDAGIGPGQNVYAELGSTWRALMADPDQAAHLLGKLLVAFGPDNILWGTDSIWYGSPQDQIQAFRAFEITAEAQERHGYPALTPEVKAKILGGNASRLHGIDPAAVPCRVSRDDQASYRLDVPTDHRTFGPTTVAGARATFAAEHPWFFV
jgi:uncharacterized protein